MYFYTGIPSEISLEGLLPDEDLGRPFSVKSSPHGGAYTVVSFTSGAVQVFSRRGRLLAQALPPCRDSREGEEGREKEKKKESAAVVCWKSDASAFAVVAVSGGIRFFSLLSPLSEDTRQTASAHRGGGESGGWFLRREQEEEKEGEEEEGDKASIQHAPALPTGGASAVASAVTSAVTSVDTLFDSGMGAVPRGLNHAQQDAELELKASAVCMVPRGVVALCDCGPHLLVATTAGLVERVPWGATYVEPQPALALSR
jgi:hypothetical protein